MAVVLSLHPSIYSGSLEWHGLGEEHQNLLLEEANLKQVFWVGIGGWALSGTRMGRGRAFTPSTSNLGVEFSLLSSGEW